jgi:magnesium-transporting ATPase (P-type)
MRSADLIDVDVPRLEAHALLLSGSNCPSGDARAIVFATGMHTGLGRIAALSQRVKTEPSPLERQVQRVACLIAAVAGGTALAFVPLAVLGAELSIKNAVVLAIVLLA